MPPLGSPSLCKFVRTAYHGTLLTERNDLDLKSPSLSSFAKRFLDEPSTGVDPLGRREIWTMISNMLADTTVPKEEKPCVLLTTHSMEECEVSFGNRFTSASWWKAKIPSLIVLSHSPFVDPS